MQDDGEVWVTSGREPVRGAVVTAADSPRSYFVDTPSGAIRRNQQHLEPFPEADNPTVPISNSEEPTEESSEQLPPNNPEPSEATIQSRYDLKLALQLFPR